MSAIQDKIGWIVRSTAGRDKGGLFCVVGVDQGRSFLLLADGRRRKLARPKAKRLGHVELLEGSSECPAARKLRQGLPLTDKELRRTLAALRDEMEA